LEEAPVLVLVAVGAGVGATAPELACCLFHDGRACTKLEADSSPIKVDVVAVLPFKEGRSIVYAVLRPEEIDREVETSSGWKLLDVRSV